MNCRLFWTKVKRRICGNPYETILELNSRGVKIGKNCHLYNVNIDRSHGFLVEIGNDVTLTNMTILAHDASTKFYLGYTKVGRVSIGDRVFAGYQSIILPGTTIGDDVIIGAGAVVRGNIPSDSVVAGNPAAIIGKTSEYISKNRDRLNQVPVFNTSWHDKSQSDRQEMIDKLINTMGFDI